MISKGGSAGTRRRALRRTHPAGDDNSAAAEIRRDVRRRQLHGGEFARLEGRPKRTCCAPTSTRSCPHSWATAVSAGRAADVGGSISTCWGHATLTFCANHQEARAPCAAGDADTLRQLGELRRIQGAGQIVALTARLL